MSGRGSGRRAALWCACACTLAIIAPAHAARSFPHNSVQVKITQVADDAIVADGKPLHLAPGVVIFTPSNTTLVRGALPSDVIVRVQLDLQGNVRRIWLLADDEIVDKPSWWQFWKSEQPKIVPVPTQ